MNPDNDRPLISVMMPCCNNSCYIESAVTSVLGQRLDAKIELLIVDDASQDDSVRRIKAIGDSRVRLIRNPVNRGIAAVRNQLLREARGDLLTSLDGDDVYASERKLELELDMLRGAAEPYRTVVYSDTQWINADGEPIVLASQIAPPAEGRLFQAILDRRVMIPRDFLVHAELARRVGGFDESLEIYEDWDYKLRLAQQAMFRFTGQIGIGYRRHGSGLSAAKKSLHETCQSVIRRKYAIDGFDGDPMRLLSLSQRIQSRFLRGRAA